MSKPAKYNFKKFKKFKPVLSVSRSTLRKSQASLYDLLVEKLYTGESVTYDEAYKIWIEKACRNVVGGKPYGYSWIFNHDKDKYECCLMPMSENTIKLTVTNWLMRNIGLLVIKGYIKAIPMVKLV